MYLVKVCTSSDGSINCIVLLNLAFAETDRPELLTRTFDHKYLVKYLPYNFTVYDGVKTIQNNQQKHWLLKMI